MCCLWDSVGIRHRRTSAAFSLLAGNLPYMDFYNITFGVIQLPIHVPDMKKYFWYFPTFLQWGCSVPGTCRDAGVVLHRGMARSL